ncbi:MAG: GAF domain-containing protein [Bacteroidales bacterium]|nr:GAF domain-containing protein [Bacteroidales bacterium]MBR3711823.1 GAF domain-containing protein [Bacteroidales bacterium]
MAANIKKRLRTLLGRSYDFYLVYAAVGFVVVMLIALIIGLVGRSGKIAGFKEKMQESTSNVSSALAESVMSEIGTLRQLSQWFVQIGNPELEFGIDRGQAAVLLQETISAEADMKSLYMVWEPNVFDGKDAEYAHTEFHDSTGRFIPKFTKRADGVVERDIIRNYNDNLDVNSYYYIKSKKNVFIQEPRILRESAKNLLVMPVVFPMHFGTKLLGVIGADFVINNLNQRLGLVNKPEGCQLVVFSANGRVAVSPDKNLLIGRGLEAVLDGAPDYYYIKFRRGEEIEQFEGKSYILTRTCNLDEVNAHFNVCMICDESVLNKEGNAFLWMSLLLGFVSYLLLMLMIMLFRWYYRSQVSALTEKGDEMADVDKDYQMTSRLYVPELMKLDGILQKYHKTFVKIRDLNREIESYRYDDMLDTLPQTNKFQQSYNNMLDTLRKIAQSENERKTKEETANWISQGIAAINEAMRIGSNKVDVLSENILMTLVRYTKAVLGGLYVYSKEDDGEYLTLNAAVSMNQKKAVRIKIQKGVGLVGTCAVEKMPIFLNKLPDDYINVFSGLGKSKPRTLAILPMLYDNELIAIIEIAFINELQPHEKELLQVISPTIASSLVTVRINEQTEQLMKQFRSQADTLAQNEKQMTENIEKLKEEQNRSLQRELEMKGLIGAVNNTMLTLEFTTAGVLLDANERFLKTMLFDRAELQGVNIKDINPQAQKELDLMLSTVADGKYYEKETLRTTKNGEQKWLWATYTPYFDNNGEIVKILYLAMDITEYKKVQAQLQDNIKDCEKRLHKMRVEMASLRNEKKNE